jgi:hypothetical protein
MVEDPNPCGRNFRNGCAPLSISFRDGEVVRHADIAWLWTEIITDRVQYHLWNASEDMLSWRNATEEEGISAMAVAVSTECVGRNVGRSMVTLDYSRHDVARVPNV